MQTTKYYKYEHLMQLFINVYNKNTKYYVSISQY